MRIKILLPAISLFIIQCYYPISYTYTIDVKSKTIELKYNDLRSDEDVDSSIARDWRDLRKSLDYHDSLYESKYYKVISRNIYQEDTALSGTFKYKIVMTDSSYSVVNMLKAITGSDEEQDVSWHATRKEIFLFVDNDADYILKNSNGKIIRTDSTVISRWSMNDSLFQFVLSVDSCCPGASLLPCYLADKSIKKGKKWK